MGCTFSKIVLLSCFSFSCSAVPDLDNLSINQRYWLASVHNKQRLFRMTQHQIVVYGKDYHRLRSIPTRDMLRKIVLLEATYKKMLELFAQDWEREHQAPNT